MIDGFSEEVAEDLQGRARESLEEFNQKTLDEARALGTQEDLIEFEGLTPQMVLALAKDGVLKTSRPSRPAPTGNWPAATRPSTASGSRTTASSSPSTSAWRKPSTW